MKAAFGLNFCAGFFDGAAGAVDAAAPSVSVFRVADVLLAAPVAVADAFAAAAAPLPRASDAVALPLANPAPLMEVDMTLLGATAVSCLGQCVDRLISDSADTADTAADLVLAPAADVEILFAVLPVVELVARGDAAAAVAPLAPPLLNGRGPGAAAEVRVFGDDIFFFN
jgi:hypothetical protein